MTSKGYWGICLLDIWVWVFGVRPPLLAPSKLIFMGHPFRVLLHEFCAVLQPFISMTSHSC